MTFKKFVTSSVMAGVLLASATGVSAAKSDKATSGSVDLTNQEVSAFATSDVGGGTWSYGTSYVFPLSKKVYSNYYHGEKTHSSTAQIGTLVTKSGQVAKDKTSYASATGGASEDTHAYWNTY